MPQYIQLPNGAYFEVKEGERPEDALVAAASKHPEAFQKAAPPPEPPKEQGSYIGDLGRSFASGAVGATGALTSVFGADNAASRYLAEKGESLQKGLSASRQAELQAQAARMKKAEESGSTWEEVKAGLLNVIEAPLQTTASAVGSFAPMVATLPLAKLNLGARAIMAVRGAIGGAQGAGAVKQSVYEAVLDAEEADGKSPEQAQAAAVRAQSYVGENLDQILLGGGLGVVAGSTGAERLLPGGVRAKAGAAQQAIAKRIGERTATGVAAAAGEMPIEGLQGGQERLAANVALQRTGRDVGTFTGVAGQATQEALAGGLGGAAVGVSLPDRSMSTAARKEEADRVAAEQAKTAEYEASDEYALSVDDQLNQVTQQLSELQQQKRKIEKGSETAEEDREFNRGIEAQIRDVRKNAGFDALKEQHAALKPRIEKIKRMATVSPEDALAESIGMPSTPTRDPRAGAPRSRTPLSGQALPEGVDATAFPSAPLSPEERTPFYVEQQTRLATQRAKQAVIEANPELAMAGIDASEGVTPSGDQLIDALAEDPGQAMAVVRTKGALPGMSAAQSNLIRTGLRSRLEQIGSEIGAGRQQADARRAEVEQEIQALRDMRSRTDGSDVARMRQMTIRERELQVELDEINKLARMDPGASQPALFGEEAGRRVISGIEVDPGEPVAVQRRQLRRALDNARSTGNESEAARIREALNSLAEGQTEQGFDGDTERSDVELLQQALSGMARTDTGDYDLEGEPQGTTPEPTQQERTIAADALSELVTRAEANPDLEEQDAQLLSQIREALPVIQQMQPVGYDGALPPTPGSVVPENAMQIVADWVYRARVGTPAEGARRDVQSLLSRIEAGRRSETEQVTQRAQRALTPEEKRQVQGTSLEGRRGVMTTEPTGQVSRAVQEDMFQDDLGTIFGDYLDFDNYLASDELDTLRTETGLVGQTMTRTAKLVAPLQSVMGKVNAELAKLRAKIDTVVAERNKQATSVSAQRKEAEALLQKEKQALLAALVKADEPLAKFEASYLETALKLATVTAQRESMAKAMQENAADLERRIQQYEKARGRRQEGLSALKDASRKLKATADLMLRMRTDEMTALGNILKGEVNQKKVSLLPSRDLQELNKKALAAHNEVIAAMRVLSPAQQLDDKVFPAFLQKEAALASELQALTSRMYGLTGAKTRARTALINARAALDNDPQLQRKLTDARSSADTAALILSAARAQEQIDTNALVVPLSFEIDQLAQGVPVLQDTIQQLQSSIDTLLNPVVQRAEQRRAQSQPKKQAPTQAEKAQAEQKRLEMMQGTNFEDVVKVTFPDVKSGRTNSEAYFKLYEKAETSRAYAAFAPADKRAEAQAEAQAAQKKLDDYVNGVSKADKARMGTMSRAAKAFMARDKERRNLRAQLTELQQRLEATREQISERTDANKPIPKALQAQLDSQLAREKEMQARLPKLQDSIKKALDAFQNASGAKAVYRSEADLFADQETDADRRESELAAIAATQTKRRVSSAATRSTSPAPTQFRTGSIESDLGLGRVDVDRGVKESTQVKQRDTAVGKKELREANTLAKQIASKTDADKIAEADAATAQAAELERITQKTLETLRVQREKAKERAAKKTDERAKKEAASGPRLRKTAADSVFDDVYSDDLDSEFASVVRDADFDDTVLEGPDATVPDTLPEKALVRMPGFKTLLTRDNKGDQIAVQQTREEALAAARARATRVKPATKENVKDALTVLRDVAGQPFDTTDAMNGKTMVEVARLFEKRSQTAWRKQVFAAIADALEALPVTEAQGRVFVTAAKMRDRGGFYLPEEGAIVLGPNSKAEIVLHELVHAASSNALRADSNFFKRVDALREKAADWFETKEGKAFHRKYGTYLFSKDASLRAYGLKNPHEFLAEAMSNRYFQMALASVPTDKPVAKNLFKNFVDILAQFFGLDKAGQKTVLAEAVALTGEIFDFTKAHINKYEALPKARASEKRTEVLEGMTGDSATDKQGLLERTAALMSGSIPGNKAKFNASVPQGIRSSFGQSVQPTKFGDRLSSWALGLRVKSLDAWGAREALVKLGLSGNKLTEAQATQTRIFMRLVSEINRFVHQAMISGPLKLSKDEKGYFGVDVDDKKPSMVNVLGSLRAAVPDIGNMKAVEELFYKHLQIKRVEEDKLGYDKINMRNPPSAQEVRELKQYIAGTPAVKAAFDKAEREYREYNGGMLDFAHSAGVFTDKEWQYFKKGSYVPFYRQTEDGNIEMIVGDSRRTIGNVIQQPQLKDLVGGEKDFLGFTESVMQNAQLLTRMSLQNLQAQDVGDMLNNLGMGKIIKGEGGANTIRFKINGENMWVKLDTDLFPKDIPAELLLQGLHGIKTAVPTALKAAGVPTQWLRSSIVRMPLYMIRQLIRDPLHAWLVTGLNFTPVVSSIKELTKIRQGLSPTEVKLMRSGAISSNVMTGDYNDAARTLRDLSDKGSFSWNSAMQSLDNLALQGDSATRAVLYDKYREQGMSHFEAALGAAEVMNFSRRGTSSSLYMISTLIPFFNAQLQGIDSVWRSGITGDTVFEDKLQVRQKLYQRAALMMGITLAYAVAMQDDEAYKNATPQERAMNWFIPLPGADASLRVPIPFEMGAVSKAIPELLFNAAFNDADSKDTLKGLKHVLGMSIPGDTPTIAKPWIEVATNYSFFRKAPIETSRDLAVSTSERYRPNTTELAKLMGQVGVSPLQVEHLMRGYFSNVGIMFMSMANPILRPFNSDTAGEPAERRLTETPFFGAAFQPNNGRGVIEAVYDDVEDWQKAANTFKRLVTEGKQSEARAFADKYAREIALSSTGGSFKQTMGELAKMRRAIQANPELSGAEKRARLTEIEEYQKQLAAQIRGLSKQSS